MKKIPKLGLITCLVLLLAAASCEKKSIEPDDINSCAACGGTFDFESKNAKLTIMFVKASDRWEIKSSNFNALVPCKFPQKLLKEGTEIYADYKYSISPYRASPIGSICIEKIY